MGTRVPFTFSLRRLLFVPVVFAVLYAINPHPAAAVFVFISATASSLLLFLVNKNNIDAIIMSALGSCLGGFFGMSIPYSLHGPDSFLESFIPMVIGAICGYLIIKFLQFIIGGLIRLKKPNSKSTVEQTPDLREVNP